jgi:hypothetical protein
VGRFSTSPRAHVASWRREPDRLTPGFTVVRITGARDPALWRPRSVVRPEIQPPARWHFSGEYAQYCSRDREGSWAERVRSDEIRSADELAELELALWEVTIEEPGIADLSTFDAIDRCGLDPAHFVDDDHSWCRGFAGEIRDAGFTGLATPSAALPGAVNVTLLGPRYELTDPYLRNARIGRYVRVRRLGEGAPPSHLLPWVRRRGAMHGGYADWLSSR